MSLPNNALRSHVVLCSEFVQMILSNKILKTDKLYVSNTYSQKSVTDVSRFIKAAWLNIRGTKSQPFRVFEMHFSIFVLRDTLQTLQVCEKGLL